MMLEQLQQNPYPGRGLIAGLSDSGETYLLLYWVMGRSEHSRNRVLIQQGDQIRTQAFDPSKLTDPSLIIYTALDAVAGQQIVSNGDQTDTIMEFLRQGKGFEAAMRSRTYEPDPPNYTPRIAALLDVDSAAPRLTLSKITRQAGAGEAPVHAFYAYPALQPGYGFCLHTYQGDGDPLPSFQADPFPVPLVGSLEAITQQYWDSLNPANRVALVGKSIAVPSRQSRFHLINRWHLASEGVPSI